MFGWTVWDLLSWLEEYVCLHEGWEGACRLCHWLGELFSSGHRISLGIVRLVCQQVLSIFRVGSVKAGQCATRLS